jgi:hypothetical protein
MSATTQAMLSSLAAESIGDREQVIAAVGGVLIGFAAAADVAGSGITNRETSVLRDRHGGLLP